MPFFAEPGEEILDERLHEGEVVVDKAGWVDVIQRSGDHVEDPFNS